MTSLLLLSNQVWAIYSRIFINFVLIIIIKFIFAHIQRNARHYARISIFCSMLRSLRVHLRVPRCWSRPLRSWSQQPSKSSLRTWISTIKLSGPPCRKTLKTNQLVIGQSDITIRPLYLCMHVCVCDLKKKKDVLPSRTYMFSTDNLYDPSWPACTSNRAKMGSLSPGMSTGVILFEAVMPTSHSQGMAEITGGGVGWNSHICLSSTTYMESSINNPYYQVFAKHLHSPIPYVAYKRVNLLKAGPICSFSGPERLPNSVSSVLSTVSSTNSSTVERFPLAITPELEVQTHLR